MARRPFFSGNYGSALGSTANAANLIARAGEAQGRMFANMGQQIGGMIQQYGLNKEKQKKNEGFIKSQSSMLDMLAEQDPDMAPQYAAYKENLNNPDVPLSTRVEFGKNLVNNITLSTQLQGQRLMQATQAQSLKEQQDTEKLRKKLLEQESKFKALGTELRELDVNKAKETYPAKIQNILAEYGLSNKQIEAEKEILPSKTAATKATNRLTEKTAESKMEILPGETSLQKQKQEVASRQLDIENELMDIVGIKGYAQMKADDLKTLSETNKAKLEQTKAYAGYIRNKGIAELISAANKSSPTFKERFSPLAEMSGKVLSTNVQVPGSTKRVPFKEYLELHEEDASKYPLNGLPKQLNAQLMSLEKSQQEVLRDQQVQVNVPDEVEVTNDTTSPPPSIMGQDYNYSNLDPDIANIMAGPGAVTPQITDPAVINMLRQGGTFRGKNLQQLIAEGAIRGQ